MNALDFSARSSCRGLVTRWWQPGDEGVLRRGAPYPLTYWSQSSYSFSCVLALLTVMFALILVAPAAAGTAEPAMTEPIVAAVSRATATRWIMVDFERMGIAGSHSLPEAPAVC